MRSFTKLPAHESSMTLHLDCTLISPDDVLEGIIEVFLDPRKSFGLIRFSNQLAICATTKHPSQSSPTMKYRTKGDGVVLVCQEAVKRVHSSFVISSHLSFNYLLNFCCIL